MWKESCQEESRAFAVTTVSITIEILAVIKAFDRQEQLMSAFSVIKLSCRGRFRQVVCVESG